MVRSKATCAYPPGRSVTLDWTKSQAAPAGRSEHRNWLNSPEYPAILCSVKMSGIDLPGDVVTEDVPLVDPSMLAITPGLKFELGFAKYAVAV